MWEDRGLLPSLEVDLARPLLAGRLFPPPGVNPRDFGRLPGAADCARTDLDPDGGRFSCRAKKNKKKRKELSKRESRWYNFVFPPKAHFFRRYICTAVDPRLLTACSVLLWCTLGGHSSLQNSSIVTADGGSPVVDRMRRRSSIIAPGWNEFRSDSIPSVCKYFPEENKVIRNGKSY